MSVNSTISTKQKSAHSTKKRRPDTPSDKSVAIEVKTRTTSDWFGRFAASASGWLGSKWAFSWAVAVIVVWGATGFVFHYSDTWQLVINTGTTIVTFLMVFLIQNTQNRDARAIHLKLDELIRGLQGARNHLVDLENMTDPELDDLQREFQRLRRRSERGA